MAKGNVTYRPHPTLGGYKIGSDGSVLTEWKWRGAGRGQKPVWYRSGEFRTLTPDIDDRQRRRFRLRNAEGDYVRKYDTQLLADVGFGGQG